ncbi:MAG: Holliday junction resolvase RuvX [Pyrinomonadaceae bacterium]|nr:Holliday junction resolvase RuvX [Pyrinomonadaceae bacterium]MCX7640128.1 Holliday junction resolvase RuvX [Pyrinomonadaceae bacterium]MDW8303284.1 Holliday junction resolvase RuvX [Acidobacteriota bacterium]
MQDKKENFPQKGRILALDIGTKRVGVAVCDELRLVARPLCTLERKSWKKLLRETIEIIKKYDVVAVVVGLPLNFDGTENQMTEEVKRLYRNYSLSLEIPVFLQDERLTTIEAKSRLKSKGYTIKQIKEQRDAEAASIILEDFLSKIQSG